MQTSYNVFSRSISQIKRNSLVVIFYGQTQIFNLKVQYLGWFLFKHQTIIWTLFQVVCIAWAYGRKPLTTTHIHTSRILLFQIRYVVEMITSMRSRRATRQLPLTKFLSTHSQQLLLSLLMIKLSLFQVAFSEKKALKLMKIPRNFSFLAVWLIKSNKFCFQLYRRL